MKFQPNPQHTPHHINCTPVLEEAKFNLYTKKQEGKEGIFFFLILVKAVLYEISTQPPAHPRPHQLHSCAGGGKIQSLHQKTRR